MAVDVFTGARSGRDWSLGSVVLPEKQERRLLAKVDDVRYDVRRAGLRVGIVGGLLAASLGLLGVASIYRTARGK